MSKAVAASRRFPIVFRRSPAVEEHEVSPEEFLAALQPEPWKKHVESNLRFRPLVRRIVDAEDMDRALRDGSIGWIARHVWANCGREPQDPAVTRADLVCEERVPFGAGGMDGRSSVRDAIDQERTIAACCERAAEDLLNRDVIGAEALRALARRLREVV